MVDIDSYKEDKDVRWWPISIFFGIIIIGLGLLFFIPSNSYRSPIEPSLGCVIMQDNGNYKDSVNILFLGTSYKDANKFKEDSDKMMNSFLNTPPYDTYQNRFNFFRIESFSDYGCTYDDAVVCKPALTQKESVKCPNVDYVAVLTDRSNVENFFSHLRSSAWMNLASLNVADDPLVFTHEFAHLFADFADEYEFGGKIDWDAPNCDNEKTTCPKFSSVADSECVIGCVNKENSRSINLGIMRDYWASKRYGEYNEWYLKSLILDNTKEPEGKLKYGGEIRESPKKVLIVSGKCNSDSNCEILNVEENVGYVTYNKFYDTSLEVKHGSLTINIPNENRIVKEFRDSGYIEYPSTFDFTVAVPIVEDEPIILSNNGVIQDIYSFEDRVVSFPIGIDVKEVS